MRLNIKTPSNRNRLFETISDSPVVIFKEFQYKNIHNIDQSIISIHWKIQLSDWSKYLLTKTSKKLAGVLGKIC